MKLVEMTPRALMSEQDKGYVVNELLDLVKQVQDGKIKAVFAVWDYGPDGTGCVRAGNQGIELVGRVEWLKQRMISGME